MTQANLSEPCSNPALNILKRLPLSVGSIVGRSRPCNPRWTVRTSRTGIA
ncbi:Uncharacterised protein [Salmonella enterica subsp. enterica]|nr:Uncharacterised protein [Salmonella enterica subsp. enterica]